MTITGGCTLRRADSQDMELVWELRNDPTVRENAFSSDLVSWADHERWFNRVLGSDRSMLFIACTTEPIGQVRLDMDEHGGNAEISISLTGGARGRGIGTSIIRHAVSRGFSAVSQLQTVHAYIKPENLASIRAFTAAGFQFEETTLMRGHPASHFVKRRGDNERFTGE